MKKKKETQGGQVIGFRISTHIAEPIGLKGWFSVLAVYWD